MPESKIRRVVIREWMALAPGERRSAEQAVAFARRDIERHSLPRRRRTPQAVMMAWLKPRTGRP
jgi:hypothetical protein